MGQRTSVSVGGTTLATYTYEDNELKTLAYGNGDVVYYTYDKYGRLLQETYTSGDSPVLRTITYQYNANNELTKVTDTHSASTVRYYYNSAGQITGQYTTHGTDSHSFHYLYDDLGRLVTLEENVGAELYATEYEYDGASRVSKVTDNLSAATYTYDDYSRLDRFKVKFHDEDAIAITATIYYDDDIYNAYTSDQVRTWSWSNTADNFSYTYTYDNNGNIVSETVNGKTTTYVYDSANQLIRENNQAADRTWVWTYDGAGNILSKKEYAYTTGTLGSVLDTITYTYGNSNWKDLLTAVDSYTYYDAVGNPLNNDDYAYTWEYGRQLASLAVSSEFAIISHPKDSECLPTGRAHFTVEAAGTNLSYQWQWFNGSTWINSAATGATTNSMNVGAAGENGTTYRCVVTDGDGNVLISKSAKVVHVPILITSQPTDWWGTASERATFTVQVTSTDPNLTYQWQWRSGSTWKNSAATGVTTNSMSVAAAGENGTTYRCMITDSAGNVAYSEPATVHTDPLGFITQPEDCICSPSGRAYFSVEAYGTGLTYQWQWRAPGSNTWYNSTANGNKTNAINEGVSGDNGTVYRCKITDAAGNVAYSEPATVIPYAITWEFTYDANGMRTGRTNGTVTYSYLYNGSQLTQMTRNNVVMRFSYGTDGRPLALWYDEVSYYYITNLQGDVVAIVNSSGATVVSYVYDAWGRVITTVDNTNINLGEINPLRYRGYIYDQETGLYYVSSRYYDPEMGRFINADVVDLLGANGDFASYNLFAYCGNNPVSREDDGGACWSVVGALVGAAVGAFISTVDCLISSGGNASTTDLLMAAGVGAASGALASFGGFWLGAASVLTGVYAAATTDGPIDQKIFAGIVAGGLTYVAGGKAYAWGNVLLETPGMTYGVYAIGTAYVNFVTGMNADLLSLGAQKIYGYFADNRSTATTQNSLTTSPYSPGGSYSSGMHRIDSSFAMRAA